MAKDRILLPDDAQAWLRNGERGLSSEATFGHLTGLHLLHEMWGNAPTPVDPADFRRCEMLLCRVPEFRARLGEMREASDLWAKLVDAWDELCGLMDAEAPGWRGEGYWSAPKTFDRMQEIGL